ncbi:MAG TPA: pilin [Patescibacteria group bacterium]|nr:pilin [Patescibacteria group bacterium]
MSWLINLAKNKVVVTVVLSLILATFVAPMLVSAEDATGTINFGLVYGKKTGLGNQDLRDMISNIINVALSMLGIVAVVIVLAGGFKWMTAGGNEDKVAEAKKLIIAGVIGLGIILTAYAIARFVLEQLYLATTGEDYATEEL